MPTHITEHAQARLQQRGIPAQILDYLLAYGRATYDKHGAEIVFFDHHSRNKVRKALGEAEYKKWAGKLDVYAVLANDGAVVTVGHRTKRVARH